MKTIGIRELKEHTGDIVREVKESGSPVEITDRGRAIVMIVPLRNGVMSEKDRAEREAAIRSLDSLAAEIASHWKSGLSVEEALREIRD